MSRRVQLVCWGSRGDVAPLVGLGRGLQESGDSVALMAARDFEGLVRSSGLDFVPFDIDVRATADSAEGRSWLGGHRTLVGEGLAMRKVLERFRAPLVDGLWERTGDADLVVSGLLTADACLSLTAARGQQHAVALLAPLLPSRRGMSSASAPLPSRETRLNLLAGQAVLASSYRLLQVPGAEIRRRLGDHRTHPWWFWKQITATPTLLGVSRHVVPPLPDQPQVHVTGYWPAWGGDPRPSPEVAARVDAALDAARARGRPVAYLGFGSMTTADPGGTAALLVQAAALAGVHPVVHSGWSALDVHLAGRDDVTVVDHVPHSWLFPRCDVVVHHGGAGTTGSAVRSGTPQVVVAHMGDQPYWAARMHRLGVAAPPLRRTGLRPARLADALRAVTIGPRADDVRRSARELGSLAAAEDGVASAVAALRA
jgi:sterol 3beta-glucosyltransferase